MSNSFVDTHAHLYMLEHSPVEEILARASEQGVDRIVTVSTHDTSWAQNEQFAKDKDHIYFSLGVHPHEAIHWTRWAPELAQWFANDTVPNKCVAIGEMGLDFYYDNSPREIQITVFEEQLHLARKVDLPVIIHCRDAFDEMFASLKRVGLPSKGGVMHCFTGNSEQAKQCLDFGLHISFSGIISFKKSETLRDAARIVPLSRALIETDCPFLSPVPNRGKPNEPSFLPFTAKALATTLGKTVEEIAQSTTQNAYQFFGLQ